MTQFFEEIDKKFGFGAMRLPMNGDQVDLALTEKMVDAFMDAGFRYFDTAHPYLKGQSETALKQCLTSRYPRESYLLTNKLSSWNFEKEEELRPLFDSQLEACGVDYFDFYLMHAQSKERFEKYKATHAYEFAFKLKEEGKVRHVGFSFHDTPEVLDEILTAYPQFEVVQLQFNYLDMEDPNVQSKACYDVCVKHGKPVIVMEPVKGGSLAILPKEAKALVDQRGTASASSYALRFAAGFENVVMVLSGMSNLEQVMDNVNTMADFKPIDESEQAMLNEIVRIFDAKKMVRCTGCRYCVEGCPMQIRIPDFFRCLNRQSVYEDDQASKWFENIIKEGSGKPSDCIECGQCEEACPQHLEIRELLKKAAELFE